MKHFLEQFPLQYIIQQQISTAYHFFILLSTTVNHNWL